MRCCNEPNLAEILHDSIVMALMRADGVDPDVLAAELKVLGSQIAISERQSGGPRRRGDCAE